MSIAMIGFCHGVNELMIHFIKKNENKIIGNNNASAPLSVKFPV
jgi:hypothetical protein